MNAIGEAVVMLGCGQQYDDDISPYDCDNIATW
jgi:hypothetical protein